jgi:hypothetical protein
MLSILSHWFPNWAFAIDQIFVLGIDLILTGLLFQPLYNFLRYGWVRKAEEISSSLVPAAKQTYLKVFWGREVPIADVEIEFSALYTHWYGRKLYYAPLALVFTIAMLENYYLSHELIRLVAENIELNDKAAMTTSAAAISGAYTFVAWDFFSRVQRRSLSATDILRGALRLAMALPIGFAFAILGGGIGPFLAFGVGVFPLETIGTILRRLVNDKLKIELGANTGLDQIGALPGIDRSIADRVEDTDITTIPQLAWCDPIQLTMRSSLTFDYVVDIVSQALAWVYLGEDKLKILRTYGLRGAYEIRVLVRDLSSSEPIKKARAEAVLPIAADAIKMPVEGFVYALNLIAEDKATEFLFDAA